MEAIGNLPIAQIEEFWHLVEDARDSGATVHFIGNGGSTATPSHSAGDWSKELSLRTISHSDNASSLTAWANDTEYDNVFVGQLSTFIRSGDLVVGFSGIARPEGKLDLAGRLYGIGTYALPPFWAAMIVQLLFAVILGWLPIGGRFPPSLLPPEGSGFLILDSLRSSDWISLQGALRHLVLPAGTLGLLHSGIFTRTLRLNLGRTLQSDYVEAARSRGLNEQQVVLNHALPNALLPVLTIAGITVASLIGGALLIEVTFSWPGIALRLQEAINQRDYPVVQGIVVVVAALMVLVSISVDLLVALIDPRVRY